MQQLASTAASGAGTGFGTVVALVLTALVMIGGGVWFVIAVMRVCRGSSGKWIAAMILAAVLTGVGALGVIGTLVGVVVSGRWSPGGTAKREVRGAGGRVRIEVPSSWRPMSEQLDFEPLYFGGHALQERYVMVIEDPKADFDGTLEQFEEVVLSGITENLSDPEIGAAEEGWVGELPARFRRIEGGMDDLDLVYHAAYIESEASFFQVMTWTMPSREAAALPVFKEVIASFRDSAGPPQPKAPQAAGTATDVSSRVVAITSELLGIEAERIHRGSHFVEDLGADSLDVVELVMSFEDAFGTTIADEDAARLRTVGEVIDFFQSER